MFFALNMNPTSVHNFISAEADLDIPLSPAKILTLAGQVLSTGRAMLQIPPGKGTFLPSDPLSPSLDIPKGTKLLVVIGSLHPREVSNWERCASLVEIDRLGHCHTGLHYHFECEP